MLKKIQKYIHLYIIFLLVIIIGCNSKSNSGESRPIRPEHSKPHANTQGKVISAVLRFEDSSISYEWKYEWQPITKENISNYFLWSNPIDSQKVSSGDHIFIGIYDKYRLPPEQVDSQFMDHEFGKIAGKEILDAFLHDKDSTTRFEHQLSVKQRYVYINEDLLNMPRFEISSLPKKYVSKFCRTSISRPIFNNDTTQCLIHMQTSCCRNGAVYLLSRKNEKWEVVKAAVATYPFVWYCG